MNILLSLLATVSISAQDMNKIVSAEVRAASAPAAIAELSKQVGYPLEAMPATKDDILIIKVTDVPLNILLQKIASATNTEWEQTANGMRLIRTDPIRRKEANEEYAKLVGQIQASLDKTHKTTAEEGEFTDRNAQLTADRLVNMQERQQSGQMVTDWQEQQRLTLEGPAYRLMRKVSVLLDAKTIAAVPEGRNVVYSNMPNRMQHQLPGNIQPLVQTYIKEQAIWAKAVKAARDRRGGQQNWYFENMSDPSNRKIGKVLLSLNRSRQSRGVQLRLIVSDEKGRLIGSANHVLGWDWEAYTTQAQQAAKTSASKEEDIRFSRTSQLIQEAFVALRTASERNAQTNVSANPEVREILINPDKFEPLSIIATDCVFETARIKNVDIVCSAPDMIFYTGAVMGGQNLKPTTYLNNLNYLMDVETSNGWLVMKPVVPSSARRQRADRVLLGQFVRQAIKEGRVSLDNRASYAFKSGMEEETYFPTYILSLVGIVPQDEFGGEWNTLRLYGSLTANQRQAAKASQPIPFRSLQPAQLEILRNVVFDSPWARLQVSYQQEDFADMQNENGVIMGGGLESEATEVLPNGFIGNETLTITDKTDARLFSKPESENGGPQYWGESAYDANSLAHEIFQSERPELFPWRDQPGYPRGKVTKVRPGTQRQINFRTQFTPRVSLNLALSENSYSSEAVAIDKLPPDIKKQIQDALARIREQYKNAKPPTWDYGGRGGSTPPPPAPTR